MEQLLSRDIGVRAIVRSADRLPGGALHDPRLEVMEADLLSLSGEELLRSVRGCDAVISCLGHVINFRGLFGPPRDLVTQATKRLCRAIAAAQPTTPVKFILMSSVSVNQPAGRDARRGGFERAFLWILRGVLPPARDNQEAADYLCEGVGTSDPYVRWTVVRPDTLQEGDVSEYRVHENLVSGLFQPDGTTMANVAHFMCEMVGSDVARDRWNGKFPVIVNVKADASNS
jgi:nucleoside-diphosphate-sugar epimerase